MTKTIVTIPELGDSRFKRWAKHVTSVNADAKSGYAFEGTFLKMDRKAELPIGAVVLLFGMFGSRAKAKPRVLVGRVAEDGELREQFRADGWDWALDLRDQVAGLFAEPPAGEADTADGDASAEADNPLAGYSTPELFDELRRRGLA